VVNVSLLILVQERPIVPKDERFPSGFDYLSVGSESNREVAGDVVLESGSL